MKRHIIVLSTVIFLFSTFIAFGDEYRIYNDGNIDFVPPNAAFVLTADDDGSSLMEVQYSIDGSALREYDGPLSISTEGRHIIVFRAIDRTNNISTEKIYPVIVDGTPPEGLASVDGPFYMEDGTYYITGSSAVVLWAEDKLSGVDAVYVNIDNAGFTEYREPVFISSEGSHTVELYAVDNVGNRTPTFKMQGYVDNTPPTVRVRTREPMVVSGGNNYTNRENEFIISASDEISGTRIIYLSLDGNDYVAYSAPFRIQYSGFHTIKAKAVDNTGNESSPVELSFVIDTAPPDASMSVSIEE